MKEVECLSVEVGEFAYGPETQVEGIKHFLENPEEEMALRLMDKEGGKGEIIIFLVGDKLHIRLSVHKLGFYLAEPK